MTFKFFKCVLVFVTFFISASNLYAGAEDDYNAGLAAQNNENYDEAAKWYRKAAEQGHAKAQYQFFRIFYDGRIASTNLEVAKKWFKRAAEQGYAEAQYQLAEMHMVGAWMFEVPKDEKEAVNWYRKAAVQGHAKAQAALSYKYLAGREGVPKDTKKSIMWLTRAAEQGHAQSQYFLGSIYNGGKLVPQNDKEAIKWFTKAAEQGHVQAMARLKKLEKYMQEANEKPKTETGVVVSINKFTESTKELSKVFNQLGEENKKIAAKENEAKASKANTEPYQNNDNMIRAMLKGMYGWEVESDMGGYKAMVGAFKIKGAAKCHPYVVFSGLFPKAAIINVNGVDVRFTAVGVSSFHLHLAALSEAGRNYMLNEFKKKNKVVVAGDKTHTFSAVGFTKGLSSMMSDCEKQAKTITNAL